MRSSPSAPDPLVPGPGGFAHRGLHGPGAPENSLAAFRAARDAGAGVECDVRLAIDDEAVVIHDADLQRLCGESRSVAKLSSSALGTLTLTGGTETIPRLATLLMLRVRPLLIELKTDGGNGAKLCAAVARAIGPRPDRVGVMSFDPAVGAWFSRYRPDVRRGLVLSGRDGLPMRWLKMIRARPHYLAVDVAAVERPWVQAARKHMPIYTWTVRSAIARTRAARFADAAIWEADGRP